MKIIQVTPSASPMIGGLESHVHHLSEGLSILGHDVSVVTLTKAITSKVAYSQHSVFKEFFLVLKRISRADVIHCHAGRNFFSAFVIIFSRKPVIFTPHCLYPSSGFLNGLLKHTFDRTIGRISFHKCKKVIALNVDDARRFQADFGLSKEQIEVVPNGFDFSWVKKIVSDLKSSDRETIPNSNSYIFTGRLDQNKNVLQLIRCADKILKRPESKLLIIGPDAGSGQVIKKAIRELPKEFASRVLLLGELSYEDVIRNVYRSKALFLPSKSEGLPTSIIEALFLGVPCVASDASGNASLARIFNSIITYKFDSDSDFVRALHQLDSLIFEKEKISELARETYSWDRICPKILRIYQEVVA